MWEMMAPSLTCLFSCKLRVLMMLTHHRAVRGSKP